MKIKFLTLVALLACVALFEPLASAQITRGSIAGNVRDESGAVIAGAAITVTSPGRNVTRNATTDDEGFYRIGALDPGTYTVVVERTGFAKVENREVLVRA